MGGFGDYVDRVAEVLQTLEYGDRIEVKWIDACKIDNVPLDKATDNAVFTSYRQTGGYFFAVVKDKLYFREHLIVLLFEQQDNDKNIIVSIPVATITKIDMIKKSAMIKHITNVGRPFLASDKAIYTQDGRVNE